jgi:hypothetical protein
MALRKGPTDAGFWLIPINLGTNQALEQTRLGSTDRIESALGYKHIFHGILKGRHTMTQTLMKAQAIRKAYQAIDAADHMIAYAIRRMEEAIPDLPAQQERLYQGERLRQMRMAVGLPRPDTFAELLAVLYAPPTLTPRLMRPW